MAKNLFDTSWTNIKFYKPFREEPPKKKGGRGYTKPALCKKARKKKQKRNK